VVLPAIFANKAASGDRSVRVWSAGCANGEEPYTVAILLDALSRQEATGLEPVVFATDIDENALERGREALYSDKALGNVRLALLGSSFDKEGDRYRVRRDIAQCVSFSTHNLLDARTPAPSDSVFGTFDLILCRNVMIYFRPDSLHAACDRLHRSLATGGYLMLGTTERLPEAWRARYRRLTSHCTIYRKLPEGFDAQGNDASGRRSGPLGDAEGA
jgi:chemotaxis methyl-accepting protein methylase